MTEYAESRGLEEPRAVETPVAVSTPEPSRWFFVLFLATVLSLYALLAWILYATVSIVLDLL